MRSAPAEGDERLANAALLAASIPGRRASGGAERADIRCESRCRRRWSSAAAVAALVATGCLGVALASAEPAGSCSIPGQIVTDSGWHFALDNGDDFAKGLTLDLEAVAGLTRLGRELTARGITVVPVVIPARIAIEHTRLDDPASLPPGELARVLDDYHQLVAWLRLIGFPTPDLLRLRARDEPFFFARDHHWRPRGSRETAFIVADLVATLGLQYERTEFVSEAVERRVTTGRDGYLRELCPTIDLAEQSFQVFRTTRKGHGDDLSAALFAADTRHAVLVGSSNSRPDFNFAGFLEESLGLPVENHFIEAGGAFDSLQSYLLSDSYRDHHPLLIVWEFSIAELTPVARGVLGVNRGDTFRQLLPAVRGACQTDELRAERVLDQVATAAKRLFDGPVSAWRRERVKIVARNRGEAAAATRVAVLPPSRIGRLSFELQTETPIGGQQVVVAARMRGAGGRAAMYLTGAASAAPPVESRIVELGDDPILVSLAEVFPLWETATKLTAVIELLDAHAEYWIEPVTVTVNGPTPLFGPRRARGGEGGTLCLDFADRQLDQFTVRVDAEGGTTSLLEFRQSKFAPFTGTALFDLDPDERIKAISVYLPVAPVGPFRARLCAPPGDDPSPTEADEEAPANGRRGPA